MTKLLRILCLALPILATTACGVESPADLTAFTDCAAMGKDAEVAAGLAAHPEWATARRANGATALHAAALTGQVGIAERLLAAGADLGAVDAEHANTVLHVAAEQGRDEFVDWLIGKKVPIDPLDQDRRTPLHLAAWTSDAFGYLVKQLLAAGAAVDARDHGDATPLLLASIRGNTEIVRILLAHGARPDVVAGDGRTPLSAARDGGYEATAKLLEAAGAK